MSNGLISRLLGLRAEELSSGDARESASQLRLPTLDERVSLYSRAVHEQDELGDEAYSFVRDRILDAMAADIAAKSEIKYPEVSNLPRFPQDANPNETGWRPDLLEYQHGYPSVRAQSLPALATPIEPFELSRFEHAAYMSAAKAAVVAQAAAAQRIAVPRRRALKLAMLAASLCAVAVIGGSITLSLLRDTGSPKELFSGVPKSDKFDVAVQSSQNSSKAAPQADARNDPNKTQAMASASAPAVVSPVQSPSQPPIASLSPSSSAVIPLAQSPGRLVAASPTPSSTHQLTSEEIANLVTLGRELIAVGKIRDARLVLKRAAEAGDATAAFALATTYDPIELQKLKARDGDSDIAMARAWYQKAKDLGLTAPGGTLQGR